MTGDQFGAGGIWLCCSGDTGIGSGDYLAGVYWWVLAGWGFASGSLVLLFFVSLVSDRRVYVLMILISGWVRLGAAPLLNLGC
jgi:hypothetical protein